MTTSVNPALLPEALFGKSQVYIGRALGAKNRNDLDEYQLWASLALELLGKSSLSKVHPALVADPTHYQSLFAACGKQLSPDVKTITAKTLFQRLSHLSQEYDSRVEKFCVDLSLRRNSELHSGESPFSGMKAEAWEAKFWYAVHVMLKMQGKGLDEWLGANDAEAPKKLLENAKHALTMVIEERIANARENFLQRNQNPVERLKSIEATKAIKWWEHTDRFTYYSDAYDLAECPACKGHGIVAGHLWHEEVTDDFDPDEPYFEFVEKTYGTEEFHCVLCGLHLAGQQEIAVAPLPEEFFEVVEREREFEPDYGND